VGSITINTRQVCHDIRVEDPKSLWGESSFKSEADGFAPLVEDVSPDCPNHRHLPLKAHSHHVHIMDYGTLGDESHERNSICPRLVGKELAVEGSEMKSGRINNEWWAITIFRCMRRNEKWLDLVT
jgi:hypothetical protein